jgi:hypothetical protein
MRGEEEVIGSDHTGRGTGVHAERIQGAPEIANATSSTQGNAQLSSRDSSVSQRRGCLPEIAGACVE